VEGEEKWRTSIIEHHKGCHKQSLVGKKKWNDIGKNKEVQK